MNQPEDPYAWVTPPPKLPKKRRQTDDGDLVQDHSAPDFGQEVNKLILRVLGDFVRADESLLDRPDELAELGRERVFHIADDHVLIDYELDTGGAPSSNAMGHAGLIRADKLHSMVDDAVEFMQLAHVTNEEHREIQSRRGRVGGKRSKRPPEFTAADFYPVAHLNVAEQMQALKCSKSTIQRLRRQYRDLVGELPTGVEVSDKPTNPPKGEAGQQEQPTAQQQVEDTPSDQLTVYYKHEDEPELPEFLDDYSYEWFVFTRPQKYRNILRQAQMSDEDRTLAQHWTREQPGILPSPRRVPPQYGRAADLAWDAQVREACQAILLSAQT